MNKKKGFLTSILFVVCFVVFCLVVVGCQKPHVHLYEEKIIDELLKEKATCTTSAIYYKSCSCGEVSDETFEYGEPIGHDWDVMSNEDGTHTKICKIDVSHIVTEACCGGAATCTNKAICDDCGVEYGETLAHTYDQQNVNSKYFKSMSMSTHTGVYYYSCSCGAIGEETFEKVYHFLDDDGKCLLCDNTDFYCEQAELDEIVCDSDMPLEQCGVFRCEECNKVFYKKISYEDIGVPIVCLDGDIASATKEKKVDVAFSYYGENEYAGNGTVKVQGGTTSQQWIPKKNFTLKLDSKIKIVDEWGKQKKYCLKANYTDFSQARNVVSAKIYGQVVKSRDIDDEISGLVNGGAIDGFPVVIFNNGNYHGLYTFNIPKDKWLFGMTDSDEKNQAILMSKGFESSNYLKVPISEEDLANGKWEIEYHSNEDSDIDDSSDWVIDSFNNMVNFLIDNDGQDFNDGVEEYLNIDRCIDAMLYTFAISGEDNFANNMLWITYDGKIWQLSMYDMDGTWGIASGGASFRPIDNVSFVNHKDHTLIFKRLLENYKEEVIARWQELRASVLSEENMINEFTEFIGQIPTLLYEAEKNKYPVILQDDNNLNQLIKWIGEYFKFLDGNLAELYGLDSLNGQ